MVALAPRPIYDNLLGRPINETKLHKRVYIHIRKNGLHTCIFKTDSSQLNLFRSTMMIFFRFFTTFATITMALLTRTSSFGYILTLTIVLICCALTNAVEYKNVYGNKLQSCSSNGMARTGYTRTGFCVDQNDDAGSHHICIDMSSATGGNFCTVTGQPNWCSKEMPCHENSSSYCAVQDWCVCQWAFSSYIQKAGGCDKIQDIVCEAINMQTIRAYQKASFSSSATQDALDCIVDRCQLDLSKIM
jgi:uncharacterized protein (DUF2237 family)